MLARNLPHTYKIDFVVDPFESNRECIMSDTCSLNV